MNTSSRTRLLEFLLVVATWTLYGMFNASQNYVSNAYSNNHPSWSRAFSYAAIDVYPWAILTPIAFLVAGRFMVRCTNWWWTLPALAAMGVLLGALHLFTFVRLLPLIGFKLNPRFVQNIVLGKVYSDVFTCWTLFAIRHGIGYYRLNRQRELLATQLEAKLALAQLEMLKMQLQPHFLFNTMHAISTLMYRDVEVADRMISRLADFLRLTLDSAGVQEVTLKREIEFLDKYLEIEQVRFGDRLRVETDISPSALDLLVPNLALQPLVENAVRHGIAPRAAGGLIHVIADVEQERLLIEIRDDGPGSPAFTERVGLTNTRARLAHLYGSRARLQLENVAGGFRARLTIPVHTEPVHIDQSNANSDR